jgi:hypothetical protein
MLKFLICAIFFTILKKILHLKNITLRAKLASSYFYTYVSLIKFVTWLYYNFFITKIKIEIKYHVIDT